MNIVTATQEELRRKLAEMESMREGIIDCADEQLTWDVDRWDIFDENGSRPGEKVTLEHAEVIVSCDDTDTDMLPIMFDSMVHCPDSMEEYANVRFTLVAAGWVHAERADLRYDEHYYIEPTGLTTGTQTFFAAYTVEML